ncbi:hypothetical protein LSH36_377g01046 [Paralvinella palmiformis]|uniref:Uncharacterized protein n=1 Tax=Paralvinella palmiformis TaxID=53620 RepID=A0AAD9JEU3_9ANNE|nr:hypothetical protein LSH36_377g01046 [Paralvinella palmiformis]
MATGSVYNDLTEIISCQICLEEFQDQNPRQLSCLHVFCEQCVENLLIKSQTVNSDCPGNVICPVCKAKSDVPGGCAANLPIFFHSRKIEDVRKQLDERHTVCKICQTDTHKAYVSSYCLQSCSGLCNACRLKHDKRHPNHSLIAVSATTINSIMCPSHDTHFEYYCMTCGTSICGKCYLGPHSDHQIFGLSYDSKEANIEIKELLMSELESADQALTRLDNIQDAVTDDMKKIRSEIDHDHKVQLTQLNERHETLCADLDKTEERIIEDIIKSRNLLQDAQQQLKKLLEENQSWLDPVKGISEAHVTGVGELVSTIVQHIPSTEAVMIKQPKVMLSV